METEKTIQPERLDEIDTRLDAEISRVRELLLKSESRDPEDFNIRGGLYKIAFEIAPEARRQDIYQVHEWVKPQVGEVSVDVAAGTGFLTKPIHEWTKEKVYAIDPSGVQLETLKKKCVGLPIITVEGSLSEVDTLQKLGGDIGKIDFVTSFGGIYHVIDENGENNQKMMFENVARALKSGGRFVAADVGEGTKLSEHFEKSVKQHCLTGHHEKWLNRNRLSGELTDGTGLSFVKSDVVPIQWVFNSKREMALFMKALHAYDMTEEEVLNDLASILGFEEKENRVSLNWPMLFFHLQKE